MEYLRIGQILKPHGVRGALKIKPLTDNTGRFHDLSEVYIEREGGYEPFSVEGVGVKPDTVYLELRGVDGKEGAEALRGLYVCVDRAHAVELPEGRYFVADLIDCEVMDTGGTGHGILTEVLETGANDVYVICGERKLLIPALKKLLSRVDIANKLIVLDAGVLGEVGLFED